MVASVYTRIILTMLIVFNATWIHLLWVIALYNETEAVQLVGLTGDDSIIFCQSGCRLYDIIRHLVEDYCNRVTNAFTYRSDNGQVVKVI